VGYGIAGRKHNIRVLFPSTGFGYGKQLFQCCDCGKVYALDLANPALENRKIPNDLSHTYCCNGCGNSLKKTLNAYPQTFLSQEGVRGHFQPPNPIPPETESVVEEFEELSI